MVRKAKLMLCMVLSALLILGGISVVSAADPIKVALVGDEITNGFGLEEPETTNYPYLLSQALGSDYQVKNFAADNATVLKTGTNLLRAGIILPSGYPYTEAFENSMDYQPNIVVIMLGTNDGKPENFAKFDQMQKDLGTMIDKYQRLASRPKVVIATPPTVQKEGLNGITAENVKKIADAEKAIAAEYGCYVIDIHTLTASMRGFTDNVHPDADATKKITDKIKTELTSSDFKNRPTKTNFDITIRIDDQAINVGDVPPQVVEGRTLVPVRAIFEALGATVDWNAETAEATGTRKGVVVKLTVGSTEATVNGKNVTLDVPATVVNGRTLVPVRFISESFGAIVQWDAAGSAANIFTNIAVGKDVEADNSQSGDTGGEIVTAAMVNDGKGYTRWSTDFDTPHYITVNLGEPTQISKVSILWEAAFATGYTIQVSDDNTNWVDVKKVTGFTAGGYVEHEFDPITTKYVRIYCEDRVTEYGYSIYELGIHI